MEAKEKGGGGCGKNGKNLYRKDGRKVQYKEDEDSEHIRQMVSVCSSKKRMSVLLLSLPASNSLTQLFKMWVMWWELLKYNHL